VYSELAVWSRIGNNPLLISFQIFAVDVDELLSFKVFTSCSRRFWSLTLREERRLKVFENRVLRRVFGPKRDEVTGEWRKLHNEELNELYSIPNMCGW
jgi:hypothetical protein